MTELEHKREQYKSKSMRLTEKKSKVGSHLCVCALPNTHAGPGVEFLVCLQRRQHQGKYVGGEVTGHGRRQGP